MPAPFETASAIGGVWDFLERGARDHPVRPAIVFDDEVLPYGEFRERALRVGAALRTLGVKPDDRVAVCAANRPEWLVTYFATLAVGGVVMTMNPALKTAEVAHILGHGEPAVLVTQPELMATAREAQQRTATSARLVLLTGQAPGALSFDELLGRPPLAGPTVARTGEHGVVVCYTSGTTGTPKGVLQSHANEVWAAGACARLWQITGSDRLLVPMPLAFLYALSTECLTAFSVGATAILLERFHPRLALSAIERHRATVVMGVPTMYRMMLDFEGQNAFDASSLRLAVTAGAPIAWSLVEAFQDRFGIPLYDYYAVSEAKPVIGYPVAERPKPRRGSCGRPVPDMEVRLADPRGEPVAPGEMGELVVRGPGCIRAYFRARPTEQAIGADGWLHTGDLARQDPEGYVYIVDRKKDLIIRGGANIAPTEVEAVLYEHPAVAEAAVFGVPDAVFGERVKAVVSVRPGATRDADELREHCRQRLADYKVPEFIEFVAELPKGPTGKILRRLLRDAAPRGE